MEFDFILTTYVQPCGLSYVFGANLMEALTHLSSKVEQKYFKVLNDMLYFLVYSNLAF